MVKILSTIGNIELESKSNNHLYSTMTESHIITINSALSLQCSISIVISDNFLKVIGNNIKENSFKQQSSNSDSTLKKAHPN